MTVIKRASHCRPHGAAGPGLTSLERCRTGQPARRSRRRHPAWRGDLVVDGLGATRHFGAAART